MDDRLLAGRNVATMRAIWRHWTPSSLELDGVFAAIQPAAPERSLFNAVFYESAGALAAALDQVASAYEEAGVGAWTVWVPDGDEDAAAVLEGAGHTLDAAPAVMARELDGTTEPPPLELLEEATLADVARINDRVYGYSGSFARAFAGLSSEPFAFYVALADGAPSACAVACYHEGDCGITAVAARPEARGRGLASGLMRQALYDAEARGCTTSTLQSTKLGYALYAHLGYQDLGRMQMWERRSIPG